MKQKRVFITGAGGTVGRATSRVLVRRGYQVVGFGLGEQYYARPKFFETLHDTGSFSFEMGSILDRLAVTMAMAGADAVIHLAALTGGGKTESQKLRCFDINVNGTGHVLAAAASVGVSRFLMVSSSAVYGEPSSNPVDENAAPTPRNTYGVSKLAAEELTKGYAQLSPSLQYTIVRLFNTYGDDTEGGIALNAFATRVRKGLAPIINGDGSQRRCYVHTEDVANAFADMLEKPVAANRLYNIGNPDQAFTLKELANKIIGILAPDSNLEAVLSGTPSPATDIREMVADIGRARSELGFSPKVTVDEGLRRMLVQQAD
jgi:nucleoside-diphosphate-sugar epimerase